MPHIKLNDICPCQSGKLFENCCARTNFKPLYAVTRPPKPKTGIVNQRCYARVFRDCSEKISREHYVSEGILKILNQNNALTVKGFPWLEKDVGKILTPSCLVGNILCERHNNALSPLDAVAIRFFKAFNQIEQEFADENTANNETVFLFNGQDIERWMLKTLFGIICSKNALTYEAKIINWAPKTTWLNMLFGTQKFQFNCGIHYIAEKGKKRPMYEGLDFAPITNENNDVYGAIIQLKQHEFVLAMSPPPQEIRGTILEHNIYRPTNLIIKKAENTTCKVIVLAWDFLENKADIEITLNT